MHILVRRFNTLVNNPRSIILNILKTRISRILSDKAAVMLMYYSMGRKWINISEPKTFCEKLQWLKLYDRKEIYHQYVDKYAVRGIISKCVGSKYLVPLIGVYDTFDEINFHALPNQFVLKCNHDSGSFLICKDKYNLDIDAARMKIETHLKYDLYWYGREWVYLGIPRKILCEQYLEEDIYDYKFYCFHGQPFFYYISQGDRPKGTLRMSFFQMDHKACDFRRPDHEPLIEVPKIPQNFDEMVDIAKKLSANFPFIRIDMFNVKGKIYCAEITFFPGGGFTPFSPEEKELEIGSWIHLEEVMERVSI